MTCETKTCRECKEAKEPKEFYKNKARKNGIDSRCKLCAAEYLKRYFAEKPEQRFHKKHPDQSAAKSAKWRIENPEKWRLLCNTKATEAAANLTDYYVARIMGLTPVTAPPELIALKRQQMQIFRLLRELKTELKATK